MASKTGQVGTARYTVQKVLLLSEDMAKIIDETAEAERLTQADVMRSFLRAGMLAAGKTPALVNGKD